MNDHSNHQMLSGSKFLVAASYGLEYVYINLLIVCVSVYPLWLAILIIDSSDFLWDTAVYDFIVKYKEELSRNEETVLTLEKLDRREHCKDI